MFKSACLRAAAACLVISAVLAVPATAAAPNVSAAISELTGSLDTYYHGSKKSGGLGYSVAKTQTTAVYRALVDLGGTWPQVAPPPPPPPPTGAVSVSPSGSDATCSRNGPACATLLKAYNIAAPGDAVTVACGTYGETTFNGRKQAGAPVVFQPATPYCATVGAFDFTGGGDYSTWKNFVILDTAGAMYQGGSTASFNVIFDSDHMNVGARIDEMDINLHSANGWQFVNNTIGPTCCGTGNASPEGIRIGIPTGAPNSKNVVIAGNTISAYRFCQYYPGGASACPSTDCSTCHMDGIHAWGLTDSTITGNKIAAEVQGIFFEPTNGSVNADNTITGNQVTLVGGSAAIYISSGNGGDPTTTAGSWTISGNQVGNSLIEIGHCNACQATFALTGNTGRLFVTNSSGNDAGCEGAGPGMKIVYSSNNWAVNGGSTGGCG